MASAPQVNPTDEGNAAQGNSASTSHAVWDDLANIGGGSPIAHNKGKRRQRASLASVHGNLSNTRGPKAAGTIRRFEGKQAQKAPQEEQADRLSQEGSDWDEEPRTFAGFYI